MLYTKLLETFILPLGDLINNSNYVERLKYWRKLDLLSEEKLLDIQGKNLSSLLKHTVQNVATYSTINLKGTNPYLWINEFPVLTKEFLKANSGKLIAKNFSKKKLLKYSSSGSTGTQTSVYMNKKEQANIRAILSHWWEWSGYSIGSRIAQTGMSPKRGLLKSIKDLLFKTYYIVAFSLSEKELESICKKLQKKNKYYLVGYASSLNVIAEYAIASNYNIKLKAVISLGDKLFSHYKKNLEKAFQCKTYDTYGCNEGFLIASQKDLQYKYIMSPHVYLEILDNDNNPVPDGEMGHVVVTRLDAYSMPLIRYKIGDLAIKLPRNKYPEKREFQYPLLQQIVGRETDIIELPNKKKLIVHSFTGIFEYITEIKQFQVVQNDLKGILIRYIKSDNFSQSTLTHIVNELQKYIQEPSFKINFEEVSNIANSNSGKPQIIISTLKT
jgi:phenylacetate-CoA ligase|tara:strand:+ start:12655 stop:13980 length:1326 start_codon:yes stop_codon:yes gene_type:complete